MANCLTRRLLFWTRAFKGPGRAVIGVIITFFSLFLAFRDGVLEPQYRDKWYVLKFIPEWSWYWWTIIGFALLLLLTLEVGYRAHRNEYAKVISKHKQLTKEHRQQLMDFKRERQQNEMQANIQALVTPVREDAKPNSPLAPNVDTEKPKHTIEMLSLTKKTITIDGLPYVVLAVPFRNTGQGPDGVARGIVAHIRFDYQESGRSFNVNYGFWIEEPDKRATLYCADTKHVAALGVSGQGDFQQYSTLDNKRSRIHDPNSPYCDMNKLIEGTYKAYITLVGEGLPLPFPAIKIIISKIGVRWSMDTESA